MAINNTVTCCYCGATREVSSVAPDGSPLGEFIRARCHLRPDLRTATATFLHAYRLWITTELRLEPATSKFIGQELRRLGISVQKSNGQRYYTGIGLN